MVARIDKKRAIQYLCDRLEESGKYTLLRTAEDSVLLRELPATRSSPRTIEVITANLVQPIKAFTQRIYHNVAGGTCTAVLLYKDGKSAFVRMVDRNLSWRTDKSLKRYTPLQINEILHLRQIEKVVVDEFGKNLRYYQPETERLEEGLRKFHLQAVELDYSHIGSDHPSYGFVENRESIDYKLPEEILWDKPAAGVLFSSKNPYKAWLEPAEKSVK